MSRLGPPPQARAITLPECAAIAAQFALAILVIWRFHLLDRAFWYYVAPLALAGFVVNAYLPRRLRGWFFMALSLTSIVFVLGWGPALWLIGVGMLLLGICHLRLPLPARLFLLAAVIGLCGLVRGGWLAPPEVDQEANLAAAAAAESVAGEEPRAMDEAALAAEAAAGPWPDWLWPSVAIWPVAGAMFMLRLIIYLYDLEHETKPVPWSLRISYFFMLPNVCCMLFPLVDFRTFERNHYSDPLERQTYQTGANWIFRGCTHLILYKLVYQYLVIDAGDVQTLGQLLQYLYVPFLLYLRVSGEFHIYIGIVRLFGFALPETHHLYYLSSSFTDFWRRTNIYWKDFMLKVFYYPAFFRLRGLGNLPAIMVSTCFVFVVTWALHAYLWFWIRGTVLLHANDALFWTILGGLVVVNTLVELKFPQPRSLGTVRHTPRQLVVRGLKSLGTFSTICVLWSFWSEESIETWLSTFSVLGALTAADLATLGWWLVGGAVFVAVAAWLGSQPQLERPRFWQPVGVAIASLAILFVLGYEVVAVGASKVLAIGSDDVGEQFSKVVRGLRKESLNKKDYTRQHRGYYEGLADVGSHNPVLAGLYRHKPANFVAVNLDTAMMQPTGKVPTPELKPNVRVTQSGVLYTTNRWGMRDRDYELEHPPGVCRVAVLGASQAMGVGVPDDQTYEALLEMQLNLESTDSPLEWEFLNFAVSGYTLFEYPAVLEQKALPFKPDAVIYVAHAIESWRVISHLAKSIREGIAVPYPELKSIIAQAGVTRAMTGSEAYRRLARFETEILRWGNRRLVRVCRERGIVPFWVNIPFPVGLDNEGDVERLKKLAAEDGFVVLDLADVFAAHDNPVELCVSAWDNHPGPLGHQMIADRLLSIVRTEPHFVELARRKAAEGSVSLDP